MPALDTHAIARTLTDAGAQPKLADAITAAVRDAADRDDHVTSEQLRTGLATLEARIDARIATIEAPLTWRFAGATLAQTGVILAAVIAILRMLS
ncbi:MAG: hypothetical protein OXI15_02045 [Chromatiales bacterium]|nr:hypothetical protein [Chromatiales bacterium]